MRDFGAARKASPGGARQELHWFERYRTTDGYSIFGGRADLKFVDDQTNREVMQREMEVLDVMTANRDRRIWAVAEGSELQVDDSNTPPFIDVITNKPGPLPGGKHVFLGGEEEIGKMTVAKGMKVNLFASEEMFPELVNPVQMAFDTKGRLWVAAWGSYPHWKPKDEMNDKLLILEDTDGDGKADKCITFADHLHNPTGFEFWGGGVLVAMAPDLLFLKDTDGDDKADVRERVLSGLDSADTHHTSNSFTLDPGGALYFQEGTFHHSQVETPYGPPRAAGQRGRVSLRAAGAEVRRLCLLRLRQSARPRVRRLGPGHRGRRHRGQSVPRGPVLRPRRFSGQAQDAAAWSTSSGRVPARASSIFRAATFPTRCRATCWSAT